jgi:hypothetical protein
VPGTTKWQNEVTSDRKARSVRDARLSLRHTKTGLELCDYRLEDGDGVLSRVEEQPHGNLPGPVTADDVDRGLVSAVQAKLAAVHAKPGDNQDTGLWTERSKLAHRPIHLQDCWLEERESKLERTTKPPTASTAKAMRHAASTTRKCRRDSDSEPGWEKLAHDLAKQRDALRGAATRPNKKREDGDRFEKLVNLPLRQLAVSPASSPFAPSTSTLTVVRLCMCRKRNRQ